MADTEDRRTMWVERVRRHLELAHGAGLGSPNGFADAVPSADGRWVAVTAGMLDHIAGPGRSRLYLLEVDTGSDHPVPRPLTSRTGSERMPKWSPDGRLAFVNDAQDAGIGRLAVVAPDSTRPTDLARLDGVVEGYEWMPDGTALLAVVAGFGAQKAGAMGSGKVPRRPGEQPDQWLPWTSVPERDDDWRRAWLVPTVDGAPCRVPGNLNIWEASPSGPDHLVAIVTDTPDEDSWYGARFTRVDLATGVEDVLATSERQLGLPSASPDGRWATCVEAVASDRTLIAGRLVVVDLADTAVTRRVEFPFDVVQQQWLDGDRLLLTGEQSMDTVVAELRVSSGDVTVWWATTDTVGGRRAEVYPLVAGHPATGLVAVRDRFDEPMAVVRVDVASGTTHEWWSSRSAGTDHLAATIGSHRDVVWTAADGWEIHGWFATPPGRSAPFPTVVYVHGGPVACWRRRFHGGYTTIPLLLAAGYAVFAPNPRGSSGRGFEFADAVHGDMGGADAHDILSGIDHLVEEGLVDPDRLGVTGASYGGYMTCQLVTLTNRFKVAAAFSPVTNWYSQHFTSNIPQWGVRFLEDDITVPGGSYWQRSPVFHAADATTPTLLGAGLHDRCTPPGQAEEFYRALVLAGVPTRLEIGPDDAHNWTPGEGGLRQHGGVLEWIERWCPPR